jgi:hypothetical protein
MAQGHTLTLIRPENTSFRWKAKSEQLMAQQRREYELAARQLSFFSEERKPLEPCPYEFTFQYLTADEKAHRSTCDDWETSATFYRFRRMYGEANALQKMDEIFNVIYPRQGMTFAMGTHSRRPKQWLLVGVIRLDPVSQMSLDL